MDTTARDAAAALFDGEAPDGVCATLERFGSAALRYAKRHSIKIVTLGRKERYDARSSALKRLGVDVDAWPAPPAGLFVVEERTMYLRSRSTMTVAHEFGHALDCALGGGVYLSSIDPTLKALYTNARAFVTPYAATGADEYFAESVRAYVEANDGASFWPRATRERLKRIDRPMYEFVLRVFSEVFKADG